MAGKKLPLNTSDFKDPFNAGQMVGMLVMLIFIEKNRGLPMEVLQQLKTVTADSVQEYFDKPSEDIFLMIDNIVDEIREL